jgi:hypothetical protein
MDVGVLRPLIFEEVGFGDCGTHLHVRDDTPDEALRRDCDAKADVESVEIVEKTRFTDADEADTDR